MVNYIEIIKQMIADGQVAQDVAEKYFPELAESEDERIRKELLIDIPKVFPHDKAFKYIAWLEKRGERKPAEWEPQIGDTFRKKGTTTPTYHLCDKCEDGIHFGFVENRKVGMSGGEITVWNLKENYELVERLKPIEQVVEELVSDAFKSIPQPKSGWSEESSAFKDKLLELFQRFRWYCKDKTLTNGDIIDYVDAHIQELIDTVQNKPWSEEDEYYRNVILYILNDECVGKADKENAINWLKSLKDRVGCEANCTTIKEWSEEDKHEIQHIIDFLNHPDLIKATPTIADNCKNWLKSLKSQNKC